MLGTLENQRNQASNQAVTLIGELAERDEKIAAMEKQLKAAEVATKMCEQSPKSTINP